MARSPPAPVCVARGWRESGGPRLGSEERKGRPAAFIRLQGFMLGFFALAAPRRGAPCSSPARAPSPMNSPPGNKAERPLHSGSALRFNFFSPLFGLPLALFPAGEGWGRGGIPILGLQDPALSSPTPPFPTARLISGRDFPTRRSTGGGKVPALQPGGGEAAGSAPLTPRWVKAAPRGWTDFLAATRGAATSLAIVERRPREMGEQGLSVMSFVL